MSLNLSVWGCIAPVDEFELKHVCGCIAPVDGLELQRAWMHCTCR